MNRKISTMIEKVKALFLNYPFVLIMSLAFVITVIYGIEFEPKKEDGFFIIKTSNGDIIFEGNCKEDQRDGFGKSKK